jgi:hypothetical protein
MAKKVAPHDHEFNDFIGYPAEHVMDHSNGVDHNHPKDKSPASFTNANRVGHGGFQVLDDPESEYAEPADNPVDMERPAHKGYHENGDPK